MLIDQTHELYISAHQRQVETIYVFSFSTFENVATNSWKCPDIALNTIGWFPGILLQISGSLMHVNVELSSQTLVSGLAAVSPPDSSVKEQGESL